MSMDWLNEAEPVPEVKTRALARFDEQAIFSAPMDALVQAGHDALLETYSGPQAYAIVYAYAEYMDRLKDALKSAAINGTNEKNLPIIINGRTVATITEKSLPKKWDYSGDPVLTRMEKELEDLKARVKDRKTLNEKMKAEMADTETGEIIKPAVPIAAGTTIAVKLHEAK